MKTLVMIMMLAFIVGCSPTVKVVRVPVPVQPPKPTLPQKPALMTKMITPEASNDQFVQALEVDFANIIRYTLQLERILEVYSKGVDDSFYSNLKTEITVE